MRKFFRRFLPNHETVHNNRWLRPFRNTLLHPRLWHLNRHSTAGAVAVGMFCGLIPGPFQMASAAAACVVFRVNLPLALFTTFYSNPLTIVPLYFVAYVIGILIVGGELRGFADPPEMGDMAFAAWAMELLHWSMGLGKPLAVGLLILAVALSVGSYFAVRGAYRWWLIRAWEARTRKRAARG
jgi:uncharacterized protein (DUF2062 family)